MFKFSKPSNAWQRIPLKHRNSALILLFSIGEYLVLRYCVRSLFHLHIGWPGDFTDYDFIIPVPLAFFLLMNKLQNAVSLTLCLQKREAIVHTCLLFCFLALQLSYASVSSFIPVGWKVLWWGFVLSILASSFFLFVPWRYYFTHPHRYLILPCLFIALTLMIHQSTLDFVWDFARSPLSKSVCATLSEVLGPSISCKTLDARMGVLITHPDFKVLISKGCGGLDSFTLFTLCFLLFYLAEKPLLQTLTWIGVFCGGLFLMFSLNVLRISFLFCLALFLKKHFGTYQSYVIFSSFFHAHAGWMIYLLGMHYYFQFILSTAYETSQKRSLGFASSKKGNTA